jgi:hypothetical protein
MTELLSFSSHKLTTEVTNIMKKLWNPPFSTNELVAGVTAVMHDCLSCHGAASLKVEKNDPAALGEKLLSVL